MIKEAVELAGKVSVANSKMPGSSFALPASACKTGGRLQSVPGSVCHKCYALRIEKRWSHAKARWQANLDSAVSALETSPEQWAEAMALQIIKAALKTGQPFHRWFDSGDLQSVAMLQGIVHVCQLTPDIKHWLPTREAGFVKDYLVRGDFPPNLVVRVSSTMINDGPRLGYSHTSTVHSGEGGVGHVCPARHQGNNCGECRACWSHAVPNVSYPLH